MPAPNKNKKTEPRWSDAEIERLRTLYPTKGWPELLREFPSRTKAAIRNKVIALDIRRKKNSRTPWTGAEGVVLRKLYPSSPWSTICAAIPRHPRGAIAKHASEFGLKRDGAKCKSPYRVIRKLREIRRNSGIQRQAVADRIGIHAVQLAKWETGAQKQRLAGFFDWVEALGYRLELNKVPVA